jgi:hypothetical protein
MPNLFVRKRARESTREGEREREIERRERARERQTARANARARKTELARARFSARGSSHLLGAARCVPSHARAETQWPTPRMRSLFDFSVVLV